MAITTSPDNIPSPTSGDPYNYVVDMAAMADGTQDALTQKANMGVGTSTQRTAALSKFPDGALWYDTTTSSEWRRVAGAWVNQDTRTAWTPVLTGSGWAAGNGTAEGSYQVVGGMVNIWGVILFGSTTTFGTNTPSIPIPVATVGGISQVVPIFMYNAGSWALMGRLVGSEMRVYRNPSDSLTNWTGTDPTGLGGGGSLSFATTYPAA